MDISLHGLTMRQVMLIALFFKYYDYEFLLNLKWQLVDVMNGILSKEHKELSLKNIYANPLLSTLFINNEEVQVDESGSVVKTISEILFTNDYTEKFTLFNKVRKSVGSVYGDKNNTFFQFLHFLNFAFEDFFKDANVTNSILKTKEDKILLMHVLLNMFKIMMIFPRHIKTHNGKDTIAAIRTKMNGRKLDPSPINYLKGDYDDGRLSDFTSSDAVSVYIASIDSYYFIYKKFGIKDKSLYILFELYDYIEGLYNKNSHSEEMHKLFKEFMSILKSICKQTFEIDIDNIF